MSKDTPKHWAAETTSYQPSKGAKGAWAVVYDATPGGRKNDDGTTSYSMQFPVLIVSEYAAEPQKVATDVAAKLNVFPDLIEALKLIRAGKEIGDPNNHGSTIVVDRDDIDAICDAAIAKAEGSQP